MNILQSLRELIAPMSDGRYRDIEYFSEISEAADEIERLRAALAGIVEWSVDHADAKHRAQNALKIANEPVTKRAPAA